MVVCFICGCSPHRISHLLSSSSPNLFTILDIIFWLKPQVSSSNLYNPLVASSSIVYSTIISLQTHLIRPTRLGSCYDLRLSLEIREQSLVFLASTSEGECNRETLVCQNARSVTRRSLDGLYGTHRPFGRRHEWATADCPPTPRGAVGHLHTGIRPRGRPLSRTTEFVGH